ncbi:MAG: hypothetical protein B7Y84_17580 [Azorhizobium sp. 32-67-21]|nr:MAG: hypothetical protein B7Y84_17580 [Azorhizobium sp. 32-67-21]
MAGVSALRQAVGPEGFRRLATRFTENTTRRFGEWADLIAAGDAAGLVTTAHAFAGVLGQFGLAGTAALARQVEHEPDSAERLRLARQVLVEGPREFAAFRDWLEASADA